MNKLRLVICTAVVLAGAWLLRTSPPPALPPPEPVRAPSLAPLSGVDFGALRRRVHFAFREEGGAFSGGHSSYHVRTTTGGDLELTAREPSGARRAATPWRWSAFLAQRSGWRQPLDFTTAHVGTQTGDLEATAGQLTHRLHNSEEGVEQSLEVQSLPPGNGPLVFQFSVAGLELQAAAPDGLHFVDPRTGLGFHYGVGTWVDASGQRSTLAPAYEHGVIRLAVSAKTLAATRFPATLDPSVSPAFGLDNPVPNISVIGATGPALSCSGSECLVAWTDVRDNNLGRKSVVGTITNFSGDPTSPGFVIAETPAGDCSQPSVVNFMSGWAVAYVKPSVGLAPTVAVTALLRSGSPLGTVLMSNPQNLVMSSPALAMSSNGLNYGLVWSEDHSVSSGSGVDLRAAAWLGSVFGTSFSVTSTIGDETAPRLTSLGSTFVAVWQTSQGDGGLSAVRTAQLDFSTRQALPLNGSAFSLPVSNPLANQRAPDIASAGAVALAAWEDDSIDGAVIIHTTLVSVDAGVSAESTVDATGFDHSPRVACDDGGNCLLALIGIGDGGTDPFTVAIKVADGGQTFAPLLVRQLRGPQDSPAVALNFNGFFVTWADRRRSAEGAVHGNQLDLNGGQLTTSSDKVISIASNDQRAPAVAYNGREFFAVWQDNRADDVEIVGARFDDYGAVLTPTGLALRGSGFVHSARPSVAASGSVFYVVWTESGTAYPTPHLGGAQVFPDGGVTLLAGGLLPAQPLPQQDGVVVATPSGLFVVWRQPVTIGSPLAIWGGLFSAVDFSGTGFAFLIAADGGIKGEPAVATSGSNVGLVAWPERSGNSSDLVGAVVNPTSGAVTARTVIDNSSHAAKAPSIAFDGVNFFVAWQQGGLSSVTIQGLEVLPNGAVNGSSLLLSQGLDAGYNQHPSVIYDGTELVVMWEQLGGSSGMDLAANSFAPSAPLVPNAVVLLDDPSFEIEPALGFSAPGPVVVYAAYDGARDAGHSFRTRAAWASFHAPKDLTIVKPTSGAVVTVGSATPLVVTGPAFGNVSYTVIPGSLVVNARFDADGGYQSNIAALSPGPITITVNGSDRGGWPSGGAVVTINATLPSLDAGLPDGGNGFDAGLPDGGNAFDGGAPSDGGTTVDAGVVSNDGGNGSDGGEAFDGGTALDGGADAGGPTAEDAGVPPEFLISTTVPAPPTTCGVSWTYEPTATRHATWHLEVTSGSATIDPQTGVMSVKADAGRVTVSIVAVADDGTEARQGVVFDPPCPLGLRACGCSAPGAPFLLGLVWLLRKRRRLPGSRA